MDGRGQVAQHEHIPNTVNTTCLVHELGREVDAELGGDGAEPALPVAVLRVELLDGRPPRRDVRGGLRLLRCWCSCWGVNVSGPRQSTRRCKI